MKYREKVKIIANDIASNCLGEHGCRNCVKECIMLEQYMTYPGETFKNFLSTGEFDKLVSYSCNLCKQCTLVCPKKFEFADFFLEIRKDFVDENNGNSPFKGHNSINMHQKLSFSNMFCTSEKGGDNNE
ncbi:MAG: 4Fe-4S dicluster domain-containing protein [Lachnospirales bacterium]